MIGQDNRISNQGYKGIGQWPLNWCTSTMMKYKITPSVDYNYSVRHSTKCANQSKYNLSQQKRKCYHHKSLETCVINSSIMNLFNFRCDLTKCKNVRVNQ